MMNKLEKGKIVPKFAPQQQKKHIHHRKDERANIDEKIEYARSVFFNARRSHIKHDIGYKSGDKHNSRVNSNDRVHHVHQGQLLSGQEANPQQH
jgi:hypothetical protein